MPSIIVVKLVPTEPVLPEKFAASLVDLTISAYGLTVQDSAKGVKLGYSTGVPVVNTPLKIVDEKDPLLDCSIKALENSILQDYSMVQVDTEVKVGAVEVSEPVFVPQTTSVATAVIIVKPSTAQNLAITSPSIRLEFKRGDLNIPDSTLDYNIRVISRDLVADQLAYIGMQPSTYFSLPVQMMGLPSNSPFIMLDQKGRPPDFTQLQKSINIILAKDHPVQDLPQKSLLEVRDNPLTAAQSLQIASEITWNRTLYPIPKPKINIHQMYTTALDSGTKKAVPPSTDSENDRKQFESDLQNYHLIHDSEASRLAGYVLAVSAAIACERLSHEATLAGITFPVKVTGAASSSTAFSTASIVIKCVELLQTQLLKLSPSFTVPAAYFYALGTSFPAQISIQQRYNTATMATEDQLRNQFQAAVDNGIIGVAAAPVAAGDFIPATTEASLEINVDQAARRLVALGSVAIGPQCDIAILLQDNPKSSGKSPLILDDWLRYDGSTADMDANFWAVKILQYPSIYTTLLLLAITQGETQLVSQIQDQLKISTVDTLVALKNSDWFTFFSSSTANAELLPTFTLPGNVQQRTDSFVQRIQKFFFVQPDTVQFKLPGNGQVSAFPTDDILQQFITEYNSKNSPGFDFGSPLNLEAIDLALFSVFPDEFSRSWLKNAIEIIHFLLQAASACPSNLRFSIMEALYTRGFIRSKSVENLSLSEFKAALAGSIAYSYAGNIFPAFVPSTTGLSQSPHDYRWEFAPVNSGGSLIELLLVQNMSPIGTYAYLHEILAIPIGTSTLGTLLAARRTALGNMQSSLSNLKTQIPLIDIVNESLEALGSDPSHPHGVFLNTNLNKSSRDDLDDHVFAAVPEHSSPAISSPSAVYEILKGCFDKPDLPYSQALDVCRSVSSSLGVTRFETMKLFHRNVTELAIDAKLEPNDFQKSIWRYPVRFEIALEYLHISLQEYTNLFSGTLPDADFLKTVFGLDPEIWRTQGISVSSFLTFTGLHYDEFLDLWRCKYVLIERAPDKTGGTQSSNGFPDCENPNGREIQIVLGSSADDLLFTWRKLLVFVRLWRRLRSIDGSKISFASLAEICNTLHLFNEKTVNDQFIRQLAALIMLRKEFQIPATDAPIGGRSLKISSEPVVNVLLCLWQGPKELPKWHRAISIFLESIEKYAKGQYRCKTRQPSFRTSLQTNINALSILAGFTDTDPWYAKPTSTIRFAEVLAKIYASSFTIGEISLLFTADDHISWDDPFPISSTIETVIDPLKLPDE